MPLDTRPVPAPLHHQQTARHQRIARGRAVKHRQNRRAMDGRPPVCGEAAATSAIQLNDQLNASRVRVG
jgi:hypothetical protein